MNPQTTPAAPDPCLLDVRGLHCSIKHPRILARWDALKVGEHLILVNDRDPVRLREQLSEQGEASFSWDYLPCGAGAFRIRITRLRETAAWAGTAPG